MSGLQATRWNVKSHFPPFPLMLLIPAGSITCATRTTLSTSNHQLHNKRHVAEERGQSKRLVSVRCAARNKQQKMPFVVTTRIIRRASAHLTARLRPKT